MMACELKDELEKLGDQEVLVLMKTYTDALVPFSIRRLAVVHGYPCLVIEERERGVFKKGE